MTPEEALKKFENCNWNKDGFCEYITHPVGENGFSIMAHCGRCRIGRKEEN